MYVFAARPTQTQQERTGEREREIFHIYTFHVEMIGCLFTPNQSKNPTETANKRIEILKKTHEMFRADTCEYSTLKLLNIYRAPVVSHILWHISLKCRMFIVQIWALNSI